VLVLHCLLLSPLRSVVLRMRRQSKLLMLLLLLLKVVVAGVLLSLPLILLMLDLRIRDGRRDHGLLLHREGCLRHVCLVIRR